MGREVWQSSLYSRSSDWTACYRPASTLLGTAYERNLTPRVRTPRVSGVGSFDSHPLDKITRCFVRLWSKGRSQVDLGISRVGIYPRCRRLRRIEGWERLYY